jgi:hypothetical protein
VDYPSRTDQGFEKRWKQGQPFQFAAWKWLRRYGFPDAELEEFELRSPEQAELAKQGLYPDRPDIWLPTQRFAVEVKSRNICFLTCADFPYRDVHLGNVPGFDKLDQSTEYPRTAVIVVSQVTLAMVVVPWRIADWHKKNGKDLGFRFPTYAAPCRLLRPMTWLLTGPKAPKAPAAGPLFEGVRNA